MDLLISLITNNDSRSQSVVELTENKYFSRSWSAVYNAIHSFYCKRQEEGINRPPLRSQERKKITDYLIEKLVKKDQPINSMLIDITSNSKKHSAKASDRTFILNNSIPEPGHDYSVVCVANTAQWAVPISIERVKSIDNKYQKANEQVIGIAKQTSDKTLNIVTGDSAYSNNKFIAPLHDVPNLVSITRQRVNRSIYDPFVGPQKKKGRKRAYGKRLDKSAPVDYTEIHTEDTKNGIITIKISEYKDRLVKSSKGHTMTQKKLNFIKVEVFDHNGKKKYKRDLWLCVSGKNKNQVSAKEAYLYYKQRFDIEHFFKFGKTKLLMGKFQTNDPDRDEDYMLFVMLAYNILYHARNEVNHRKSRAWDNKPVDKSNLSPSQVYRSISHIGFDDIINPPKHRGMPTEANIRRHHSTKPDAPVIRKQKAQDKLEISIKSTFGKKTQYAKTSINRQLSSVDNVSQHKEMILAKATAVIESIYAQLE